MPSESPRHVAEPKPRRDIPNFQDLLPRSRRPLTQVEANPGQVMPPPGNGQKQLEPCLPSESLGPSELNPHPPRRFQSSHPLPGRTLENLHPAQHLEGARFDLPSQSGKGWLAEPEQRPPARSGAPL